jgi:GT2 family glycosyltransferase
VVRSAGTGLAAARQLGAEVASGRYVAYVDSDVVLGEGCLEAMARVLESDATIGGVQPMIELQETSTYWGRGEQSRRELDPERVVGDRQTMGCTATMFRRDLILEHRFDPFFVGAGEDIDFSRRLKAAGWRLYRTDARAYHRSRESLIGFLRQRFWYGRGAVRLAIRNRGANQTELPPQPHVQKPHSRRALMAGRFSMLPFFLFSGAAFHLGRMVEWLAQMGRRPRP